MKKRLKVAMCDTPRKVERTLKEHLESKGYQVVYAGPLRDEGKKTSSDAKSKLAEADVWLTKWSFCLIGGNTIFDDVRPREGILTMSVGTDHIDIPALESFGLRLGNCPTYCSNSVAEHAIALAFGQLEASLPFLTEGPVVFRDYRDSLAETVVAHILMRCRQMDMSVRRARKYDYARHDLPWNNKELSSARIGVVGGDAPRLARILSKGFGCQIQGTGISEESIRRGVQRSGIDETFGMADYVLVFRNSLRGELEGLISGAVDSTKLQSARKGFQGSKVAVLGTGNIGSGICRMALGFGCDVSAYSRSRKQELEEAGVVYKDLNPAVSDADFIFVAIPLNGSTRGLMGEMALSGMRRRPVIVNVTRDEIVDSESLYRRLQSGDVSAYGTDVLPSDKVLWKRGEPEDITRRFAEHPNVFATPHEADASEDSLRRLCNEAEDRLKMFERDRI